MRSSRSSLPPDRGHREPPRRLTRIRSPSDGHGSPPDPPPDAASRHDADAAAGDPSPAALHGGAPGAPAEGAGGESAPRGGAGRRRAGTRRATVQGEARRPRARGAEATPRWRRPRRSTAAPDLPFDISEVIFGPPEERSLVQQEEHEETRFENFVGTPTVARRPPGRAAPPDGRRRPTSAGRRGDHRQPRRGRLPARRRRGDRGEAEPPVAGGRAGPRRWCRASIPSACAARDLRECLLLQLRDPTRAQPATPLAIEILDQHFEALQRLQVPRDRPGAQGRPGAGHRGRRTRSQTLEPKPGRRFASVETRYVVPDVLVKKVGDDYAIILNEDGMPAAPRQLVLPERASGRGTRRGATSRTACAPRSG